MSDQVQFITSQKNPKVQLWKSLQKHSARSLHQQFIVEGYKMVEEGWNSGWKLSALIIDDQKLDVFLPLVAQWDVPVFSVATHVFQSIAAAKTPQGIMAAVHIADAFNLSGLGNYIIILDEVQDPGNVGTILRTADAAGFTGALLSANCADVFSPKTLRSTMGSVFHLPFVVVPNLSGTLKQLQEAGYSIVGSQLGAAPFFSRSPIPSPLGLVVGNEGNGISKEVLSLCNLHYALPMEGKAESLNVSIAAGIMMYDVCRNEMKK